MKCCDDRVDVVVLGGTPGGIAAAIAAARLGCQVVLVEEHAHLGGMAASGLGKSDIENRAMIKGIFKEFIGRVKDHYVARYGAKHRNTQLCNDGYYYEPAVAESVCEAMLAECPNIKVLRQWRLDAVEKSAQVVTALQLARVDGSATQRLPAHVFIDATYEGDLYAAAGAEYRLGREGRDEFDEPHAGIVYYDYQTHTFLAGTTGGADTRLPAYTYRLCLTLDPTNAYQLKGPPHGYDRANYLGYFDDLAAGRLAGPKHFKPGRGYYPPHFNTMMRTLSVAEIPNNKVDANINPRPLGFPFAEENCGYVEGDSATRAKICERHRELVLGLVWFLQNDTQIPLAHRQEAKRFHLPLDEFRDNNHFPFQLYVREARRLVGEYTLTEHDISHNGGQRAIRHHHDTIAIGEFPIDSFPCRKRQPQDTLVLEGYLGMLDAFTLPYEIPYRIMLPRSLDGVIVPVAASTTHVAYSSIRMEPTWMALGQAAGVAAHLAIKHGVTPRHVPTAELRALLIAQKQVLQHDLSEGLPTATREERLIV